MPTSTFFRLPEEKQARLVAAGWTEITRVRLSEASINRIISHAHIPRGSFYQYFVDKEDMIRYLLKDVQVYFIQLLSDILERCDGDLLRLPLDSFDRFMGPRDGSDTDPMLLRVLRLLQLNQGTDILSLITSGPECMPPELLARVDAGHLRFRDPDSIRHAFFLSMAPLASAVAGTLLHAQSLEDQREILQFRLELLRFGCEDEHIQRKEVMQ